MIAEIAELASRHGRIAIDTEFVSERRYQALLCLAQVAVPEPEAEEGVRTEVLDPLDSLRPEPLARVLADPDVEVVVHAGRQDIALLRREWHTEVRNVFDTQIAAGFLGLGSQERYESLVAKLLGVRLRGAEGFTRWDRRPLTRQQIAYARDDARLLLALGTELERRLAAAGRLTWSREECRSLEQSSDDRNTDRIYARLPRLARLRPDQRAVACELVGWRERTARSIDRPAGNLMPDQVLVELARRSPPTREALEDIRGLPTQTVQRRGRELLEVIARGRRGEPPPPPPATPRRDPTDAPLVALAQALVRHRSQETGVAVDLIATHSELAALVEELRGRGGGGELRVARGWRAQLVGNELQELLTGRRRVGVGSDGRLQVEPIA